MKDLDIAGIIEFLFGAALAMTVATPADGALSVARLALWPAAIILIVCAVLAQMRAARGPNE